MQEARQIFTQLDDLDKEDMNMNHKTNKTKGTRREPLAKGGEGENKLETLWKRVGIRRDKEIWIQWRGITESRDCQVAPLRGGLLWGWPWSSAQQEDGGKNNNNANNNKQVQAIVIRWPN